MNDDDELCLCFHITKRKVKNFIRIEKPKRVAQLSECYGAGTGCGWCRPFLERLFKQAMEKTDSAVEGQPPKPQQPADQAQTLDANFVKYFCLLQIHSTCRMAIQ